MKCPRCGNEWDATKGACTRCGFVARTVGQSGSFPNLSDASQRNSQQSGGLSNSKQQSGGIQTVKQQSGGLAFPVQPTIPANGRPRPMTPVPPQGMQQAGINGTDTVAVKNGTQGQGSSPTYPVHRPMGYPQQNMRRPQTPVQPQSLVRRSSSGPLDRNTPLQQVSRPASSLQQTSNASSPMRLNVMASGVRSLLPGVLLRGGRYRLHELQERQEWLSGVYEAMWIGKDAHRSGAQVMICEVVLPENPPPMTQTILRTATMALATVGRHPHIPGLWDAFGDQGRSFFVFEPIEGETFMARMRYSGRTLPEQEVIECCLQLTDVLELLSQQSPQLVHGLIRPEHIALSRNGSQYILTNFSVVLAGGATQYIAGIERSRLSAYTAPEFVRGVLDVRTDIYSLIATAYHAVTGGAPSNINGSIPQAQRVNPKVSSAFDAILSKGLRTVPNQRYQRPSELRQDLLAMRSVSGSLVSGQGSTPVVRNTSPSLVSNTGQRTNLPTQQSSDQSAQALPLLLNTYDDMDDQVLLLPKPEDLPPMKAGNDTMIAAILLSLILATLIVVVVMSHMLA
jgi:serine/threonine protein kinase